MTFEQHDFRRFVAALARLRNLLQEVLRLASDPFPRPGPQGGGETLVLATLTGAFRLEVHDELRERVVPEPVADALRV